MTTGLEDHQLFTDPYTSSVGRRVNKKYGVHAPRANSRFIRYVREHVSMLLPRVLQ